jgi:hypothetical protein
MNQIFRFFKNATLNTTICIIVIFEICSGFVVLAENKPYSSLPIHLKYNDVSNADKPLLKKGFIDVTKAPYNAKGDNSTDDTQAIQAALIDAYTYNFIVYLPGDKTYLVSQQLKGVTTTPNRKYGYQIIGSTVGAKPVIRLANYAASSFIATNKVLFLFQLLTSGKSDPASNYSAFFRGIDINMGVGNSTISAISMDGAQYCAIEDVKITGDFYAGVVKLPGSGGYVVNLEVIGGQIGILQDAYRPTPTVIGLKLENQIQYGIRMTVTRGPLVISGFQIKSPATPSASYRAVSINSTSSGGTNGVLDHGNANLCLTDGSIEVFGSTGLAIENYAQDVTMNNVYVKASTIINSGAGGGTGSVLKSVAGNSYNWNKITNYMFTSKLDKSTVVCKLVKLNDQTQNYQKYDPLILETPSADFTRMHSWTKLPSWEDKKADGITSNVVDITEGINVGGTLYRATADDQNGTDDDGIAIQKIIDEVTNPASPYAGMIVYLPRGYFQIKKTLTLNSGLVLIGSGKSISRIEPFNDWIDTPTTRAILLESQNVVSGSLFLLDFGINNYAHTQALHIQTPNTVIVDLLSEHVSKGITYYWNQTVKNAPTVSYILFNNNAGGKIYNLVLGGSHADVDAAGPVSDYLVATDFEVPLNNDYHMLMIEDNANPLSFYHLNVERLRNSPQIKFLKAKNITVHGFKYEFNYELLEIRNSDNVKIYGGSGNYQLMITTDRALLIILNSTNIFLENIDRTEFFTQTPSITSNWILHDSNLITGSYGILHYDNYSAETAIRNTTFNKNNVVITPNPTKDFIDVAFNDYSDFAGSQLKIQNCMGQQVFQSDINSNKYRVNSKSWGASGIYFVSVSTKNGELIEAKKIIKI